MKTDTERKMAAVNGIAENFGKEFSPELLKMWLRLLRQYPPELVEAGAVRVIETYAFKTMPPFAILREAIEEAAGVGPRTTEMQAAAEWSKLQSDISRYGVYGQPEDTHPTTAHVLRIMGGWQAACCWETRYLDFKRKEFVELWVQSHGKAEVLALGANAVRLFIAQASGNFTPIGGTALPERVVFALEAGKQ